MGHFLNPGNDGFAAVLKNDVYVDKTELIAFMNRRLGSSKNLVCSTRPRRFGKTFAAMMLSAYYSRGADSSALFEKLAIANPPATDPLVVREQKMADYRKHLNQYDVIFWDIVKFTSYCPDDINKVISVINERTTEELQEEFPGLVPNETKSLSEKLSAISRKTGRKFFIIIDEWDALFREAKNNEPLLTEYIRFLRGLFKGADVAQYLVGCYLTGILPIKKYGTESALTDFSEFTLVKPMQLGEFVGFTEKEVKALCEKRNLNFGEMRRWYDGYHFENVGHVYNPCSVIDAVESGVCDSYWTATETYESLRNYIELNFDGLLTSITDMLGGVRQDIDVLSFKNDLSSIQNRNDVLTLLIHLGYLGYDRKNNQTYIPNEEIRQEFVRTLREGSRRELVKAIELSDKLLKAVLHGDEVEAGLLIGEAHNASTAPTFYNNEQALRSVIIMAFLTAVDHYHRFEEVAGGRGYVDLCFIPHKTSTKPPILVELKWDKPATDAVSQVKEKHYTNVLRQHGLSGEALLVGVTYRTQTGEHLCHIERVQI